eukprot:242247-Heterocapsa_arctica.AAC.1
MFNRLSPLVVVVVVVVVVAAAVAVAVEVSGLRRPLGMPLLQPAYPALPPQAPSTACGCY